MATMSLSLSRFQFAPLASPDNLLIPTAATCLLTARMETVTSSSVLKASFSTTFWDVAFSKMSQDVKRWNILVPQTYFKVKTLFIGLFIDK